jgi:hypothetical protein
MRCVQADRVPLWNLWRMRKLPFRYTNQVERAEAVLGLGLDDTLLLQPPLNKTEHFEAGGMTAVEQHTWIEQRPGERYPLLVKRYATPAGELRQVVRMTEDWPYGEHVRLFSDHNVPRALEFAVKSDADIERLGYLLADPPPTALHEFRRQAAGLQREARRLGVVLEGGWSALGDAALWLLGTETLLYWQTDHPDWLDALLDLILAWELRRMDLLLENGAEVLVHSAWYESTNFWSPRTYRRFLKPRLRRLVEQAHAGGALFSYIITSAWAPLRQDLLELGIDSLIGIDPVQDRVDLSEVKAHLGGKICLWGGLNGAVTLENDTPQAVRAETRFALETMAPGGGFVLYPVDQLGKETPWENVTAMIETWREFGTYHECSV